MRAYLTAVLALQRGVASVDFQPEPGRPYRLRFSAGAATYPYDGPGPDELMAAEDRRMYHDKSARKERHSSAADPVGC